MRSLNGLWTDEGLCNPVMLALKLHRIGGPDFLKNLDRLIGALAAIWPSRAGCLVFIRRPSDTESRPQPSAGQNIESGQPAGQQNGIVPGNVEYAGCESDAARVRGGEHQSLHGIEHVLVLNR